jgi:endo-1,4-beta-xylanase
MWVVLGGLCWGLVWTGWGAPTAEEILAGASERIEKHRKSGGSVRVVDAEEKPIAGARVEVEQRRHAFLFGCNIFQWGKLPDEKLEAAYREHFAELLNYATLPFYWPSYERRKGEPMHAETERVARWCQEHGIVTKGHPLAWNMGDPPWLPDDPDEIYRLQLDRVGDCIKRFAGLIDRWDVVNEVTHFDRPDFVNRRAPKHSAMWKKIGRIEFTRACFERARQAGPTATLLINDYRTDPEFERVIEQLVDGQGKRLYDVIGIQSHMHDGPWPTERVWEVCERFARFGVPLHFTETTLLSGERGWERPQPWPSTTPKPMFQALRDLIKGRWWTRTTLETDGNGEVKFRGFLGDYRVTVKAGGREMSEDVVLSKGGNSWVLKVR